MRTTIRNLLACAAALGLLVAACSSAADDSGDATSTDDSMAEGSGEDTASAPLGADDSGTGGGGAVPPTDGTVTDVPDVDLVAAQLDRKIVYTGELRAEVDELGAAVRSARDAVAAEGGFVFGQEVGAREARLVLKVPSVRFDAAFDAVVGVGKKVTSQHIEADDVSEQYTDLQSRQATLATSIDRLRGFLAEAGNVDEISRLETELTRREAEHDVIAAQLRVLSDRTSLGTITATFTVPADEAEVAMAEESGPPGFGRGLEVGWDAVVVIAGAVATAAGFALPFLPVLALAAVALWWHRRRISSVVAPEPT